MQSFVVIEIHGTSSICVSADSVIKEVTAVKNKPGPDYEEAGEANLPAALHELILVGIYRVLEQESACTFERLVAQCFNDFPKAFRFKRYPRWPDALKFDRPIRTLRQQGLITGSIKQYLYLTESGRRAAERIIAQIGPSAPRPTKRSAALNGRSGDDRLITALKGHSLFRQFKQNPKDFSPNEDEIREFLGATLETPPWLLRQNCAYLKRVAEEYSETDLRALIAAIESQIARLDWRSNNGKGPEHQSADS